MLRRLSISVSDVDMGKASLTIHIVRCHTSDNFKLTTLLCIMSPPESPVTRAGDSPDPSSHAVTVYDPEGEWVDEEDDIDDDDMEYEPTTEDSEDVEFFETEDDGEFHGAVASLQKSVSSVNGIVANNQSTRQTQRMA